MQMKRLFVLCTWAGLMYGLVACQSNQTDATPTTTATMTRMSEPAATPATRARPTATLVPTPEELSLLPTMTPEPTATPLSSRSPAPAGWKFTGNRLTGIQLAVPNNWVNFTGLLDAEDTHIHFGPLQLIVADSKATGTALINDNYAGDGRFALAFLLPPAETRPETTLLAMLSEVNTPANPIITSELNDLQVAYTDVQGDPLQLVSRLEKDMRLRLALFVAPESNQHVLLVLGAGTAVFARATPTFEQIMESVQLSAPAAAAPLNLPTVIESELVHGQVYDGQLAEQESHYFRFSARGGQYITLVAEPVDGLDLELTLIDPIGRTLAFGDNGYAYDPELIVDAVMPRNGTYFIKVGDFFGQEGAYALTLLINDTPQYKGGEIAFGQEVSSQLYANEHHSWVFQGTAGQTISIIVTPLNEQMDIVLRLYGPEGEKLVELDEGFSGDPEVIAGFMLDVSASYTIEVKDFSARNGAYTLSLDEGGDEIANFYDAGDLISGDFRQEVLQENEIQAWFFFGFAGDEISITATPLNNNVDLYIWLLSPQLNRLTAVDDTLAGESERIDFLLAEDGQYIILVQDFFGEPGAYQISYTVNQNELLLDAGSAPYNQLIQALLPSGKSARWQFVAQAEEIISIKVTPLTSESDLVVIVRGPDGYVQFTLDNNGSGGEEWLLEFTVPSAGAWTILVKEFQGQGGEYTLLVERR